MKTVAPYTPIQYVVGKTEFLGLDLMVDERVLIPRPETELLVERTVDTVIDADPKGRPVRVLDLCTGSGNIAIAILHKLQPVLARKRGSKENRVEGLTKDTVDCRIVASDISDEALDVARSNAKLHGIIDEVEFVKSDLFSALNGLFDIIVTNPPYIARHEFASLQKEVLREPRIALDGGDDGLEFYRRIIGEAPKYLDRHGSLIMEIGFGQKNRISGIVRGSGCFEILSIEKDHNDIDRVLEIKWKNS